MSLSVIISRLLFQMKRELRTKTQLDDSRVKYASLVPVSDYDKGEMKTACSAIEKRLNMLTMGLILMLRLVSVLKESEQAWQRR